MSRMIGLASLGRDAEVRYTPDGQPVCNLSLAFSYGRKGDNGKRPTTWVDASLWGKLAEAISPYMLKGGKVFVVIDDVHLEYFNKGDGSQGVKIAGRVNGIELAGGQRAQETEQAQRPAARPAPTQSRPPQQSRPATGFDDMDDDTPF